MRCSLGISNFLEETLSFPFYCFPLFLCIDHWGRLSYFSLLFFGTLHSDAYIFPFLLCFSLLFFSQLFVRPPQTAIFFFAFLFHGNGLDPCFLYNVTNLHPLFIRHSVYQIKSLEFICHFQCIIIRSNTIMQWQAARNQVIKCRTFISRLNKKLSPEVSKSTEPMLIAHSLLYSKNARHHLHVNPHLAAPGEKKASHSRLTSLPRLEESVPT